MVPETPLISNPTSRFCTEALPLGTAEASISRVHLDYAAMTPIDEEVLEQLCDAYQRWTANPMNVGTQAGRAARRAIVSSQEQIAQCIGAHPDEILFTSGATESNLLAIKGACRHGRTRMVTAPTEHASVLKCCEGLASKGIPVSYLTTDSYGRMQIDPLIEQLTSTSLVSLMYVNNETGWTHDVTSIGAAARQAGALFHCDATQALGRVELRVDTMEVDLMSFSGAKIYGPSGIGFLYVKRGTPLSSVFYESSSNLLRPGTPATAPIVALSHAVKLATEEQPKRAEHLRKLSDHFRLRVNQQIENTHWITALEGAAPGILSVAFEGIEAEALQARLPQLEFSTTSACQVNHQQPSHVLQALGIEPQLILSAVRFSFGRHTTLRELEWAITQLAQEIQFQRDF